MPRRQRQATHTGDTRSRNRGLRDVRNAGSWPLGYRFAAFLRAVKRLPAARSLDLADLVRHGPSTRPGDPARMVALGSRSE